MAAKEQAMKLMEHIEQRNKEALLRELAELHPADAAEKLADLSPEQIARFLETVGVDQALTIFEFVPFELQKEALGHLSRETLVALISQMSPDDRADLVEELDENFKDRLLALLIQAERQNILNLITYPEDSAGAYMTTDYSVLRPDTYVRAALEQLRFQAPTKETIYYVYVVDQARHLIGFVSLRDLIVAHPDSLVRDIMHRNVISVRVDDDIEDVAKEMVHYDFLAIPVVDGDGRLVGIITYDDVFDVMTEEATEDMYLLANLDTEDKVTASVHRSVKLRVPWLLVNLCTATVASYTVNLFSDTIAAFVVIASFMPIVAGLGGNAGTQTLTVVVRALALGELGTNGDWRVVIKELAVGLLNGCICGLVMAGVAYLWHHNIWLSLIVWLAMTLNLVVAAFLGALVPISMRKLRLDPALGSSIFVTAATDTGGYFILFGLTTFLLQRLLAYGY